MRNIFTDHLKSVGENYFEHFLKSFSFGMKLLYIALGAFIRAIFPWFLKLVQAIELVNYTNCYRREGVHLIRIRIKHLPTITKVSCIIKFFLFEDNLYNFILSPFFSVINKLS